MFHIHRWSKWSEIKQGKFVWRNGYGLEYGPDWREYQDKTCSSCGKVIWRII